MKLIIVDDCEQNGRTYVSSWRIRGYEVVAKWTEKRSLAVELEPDVARLVSLQAGGTPKKVKTA